MSKRERKQKASAQRKFLIGLCIVLSVILVALIAVAIWLDSTLGLISREVDDGPMSQSEYEEFLKDQKDEEGETATGPTVDPNDINWDPSSGLLETSDNIINILLIGQDRREGEGRQRSDAMILCTVNMQTKTLTLTSFMRDMYVQIPGYYDNRINTCYMLGGMTLLNDCLEKNFGIDVDGNFEVDFGGFMGVIDLVGGVDMELTADEAAYLNRRGNWDVSNTAGTWSLKEGMNHLTGEQALAYSRIRNIGNADFGRTERQRKVLNKLLEECNGMSIPELNALLREVLPMITTDLTNAEIVGYAMKFFPILTDLKVNNLRVPADGTYRDANVNGMEVLIPDLSDNREILSQAIQK